MLLAMSGCGGGGLTPDQKVAANRQWERPLALRCSPVWRLISTRTVTSSSALRRSTRPFAWSPDNPTLHVLAAEVALERDQLETADAQLTIARKLAPTDAEAQYLSGVVLERWQQPQKASDFYVAAMKLNPQELAYPLATAEMLVTLGRTAEAVALLQSKADQFEHSAALRDELGQLLVQEERYADAEAALRSATILAPEDQSVREHLALVLIKTKSFADAAEQLDRLLKDPAFATRGDLFAAAGQCRLMLGDLPSAREDFESATRLQPDSESSWLALTETLVQIDDLPRADLSARRAVSINGQSAEAMCLLGYVELRENQLAAALSHFRQASNLDPGDQVSLRSEGWVLTRMGRSAEAGECYRQADSRPGRTTSIRSSALGG